MSRRLSRHESRGVAQWPRRAREAPPVMTAEIVEDSFIAEAYIADERHAGNVLAVTQERRPT